MNIIQDSKSLREISTEVLTVEEANFISENLVSTLSLYENGVGLSAIQIGIPKKMFVLRTGNTFKTIINPVVVEASNKFIFNGEGCLSFVGLYVTTSRYREYVISHKIVDGNHFIDETLSFYYGLGEIGDDGIVAIAVQHEIDHLNGKLIIDHNTKSFKSNSVGRNDKCLCGSGKKYKNCCLKLVQ